MLSNETPGPLDVRELHSPFCKVKAMLKFRWIGWVAGMAMVLGVTVGYGQDQIPTKEGVQQRFDQPQFSPYAGRSYPTRVLWGDTHLHTAVSVDAGTMCRLGQEDAYRFVRGEEVTSTGGLRVKLSRPLDFVVISDHAEMYGLMPQLLSGDPDILATEKGRRWHEMIMTGNRDRIFDAAMEIISTLKDKEPPIESEKVVRKAWQNFTALADRYNEPGRFTALIGYEYTTRGGFNLHRNVVFRVDASVANRMLPFSQYDSQNPEDLWRALAKFQQETGAEVLTIPHNGNLSNGRMFSVLTNDGNPLTREIAELRARMEPLVEVTQIKGDGEAHPFLSPNDEFADYETWDLANLDGSELKTKEMLQYEYARSALKIGLQLERKLGVNPFKFGMIGSTDAHTGLTAIEEDNFFGKHSGVEPEPQRWEHEVIRSPLDPNLTILGWQQASSGYAAVWATENTREAVFDAMQAQGSLRHDRFANDGPLLRRLGFHGRRCDVADARARWLWQGCADGRRFAPAHSWKVAFLPGCRNEGPVQWQPGSDSNRQGLVECRRHDRRKGLRCRRFG